MIYLPRISRLKMFHISEMPELLPLEVIRNQKRKWEVVAYNGRKEYAKIFPKKILIYRSFIDCLIWSVYYNVKELKRLVKL